MLVVVVVVVIVASFEPKTVYLSLSLFAFCAPHKWKRQHNIIEMVEQNKTNFGALECVAFVL